MTTRRLNVVFAFCLATVAGLGLSVALAQQIDSSRPTVLVTGSNRGIGLAFAQYYAGEGWNVIATARSPDDSEELQVLAASDENVIIEQLDVTDWARIGELATAYAGTPIDVLINNAGIYGDRDKQKWGALDPETFREVNDVNVLGPLKMAEAFADHVAASRQKKIISITSGAGSVSPDRLAGGGVFYGVSKAALNMAMRKARAELEDRGIIVATISPGIVNTDMLATNRPSLVPRARTPEESVAEIAAVIASLDHTYDGRPLNHDGTFLPW